MQVRNIGTVLGRRSRDWRKLWTKSVRALAAITNVNEAPEALNLRLPQKLRQLCDVGPDPPRLVPFWKQSMGTGVFSEGQ